MGDFRARTTIVICLGAPQSRGEMSSLADSDATVVIGADGSFDEASAAALELLGLSIDELRALPPGALSTKSTEDQENLRGAVEHARPDAVAGVTTIRRGDGSRLGVRFVIRRRDDGRWEAVFASLDRPQASRTYKTAGSVLTAWRDAERRLDEVPGGSDEERELIAEISRLRADYRELFDRASVDD